MHKTYGPTIPQQSWSDRNRSKHISATMDERSVHAVEPLALGATLKTRSHTRAQDTASPEDLDSDLESHLALQQIMIARSLQSIST